MAQKKKSIQISFKLTEEEYNKIYDELFEEIMNGFCDDREDEDDDPKDLARDEFDGKTPSDIVKEYLWWKS